MVEFRFQSQKTVEKLQNDAKFIPHRQIPEPYQIQRRRQPATTFSSQDQEAEIWAKVHDSDFSLERDF